MVSSDFPYTTYDVGDVINNISDATSNDFDNDNKTI